MSSEEKDNDSSNSEKGDTDAELVLSTTSEFGRIILKSQLEVIKEKNFDFDPAFLELSTHLFQIGTMWKFGEQYNMPTDAHSRAFLGLMNILIEDGVSFEKAKKDIQFLNGLAKDSNGNDNALITIGYKYYDSPYALATFMEQARNEPKISGKGYRLLNSGKYIALILAIASSLVALLINRNWWEALGIGVIVGVTTLAITLALHKQQMR